MLPSSPLHIIVENGKYMRTIKLQLEQIEMLKASLVSSAA